MRGQTMKTGMLGVVALVGIATAFGGCGRGGRPIPMLASTFRSGDFVLAASQCHAIYGQLGTLDYRDQTRFYYFCGNTYFGLGQYDLARQYLMQAAGMRTNNPRVIPGYWRPTIEERLMQIQAIQASQAAQAPQGGGLQPQAPGAAPGAPMAPPGPAAAGPPTTME